MNGEDSSQRWSEQKQADRISPLEGLDSNSKLNESIPLNEVINVLNKSTGLEDDGHEKSRIKSEMMGKFERLDKHLDVIVKANQSTFGTSVSSFTGLATNVTEAHERVAGIKENIMRCKDTLTLRKENFVQLWCSSVELTEMLRLLDLVEDVRKVPEQMKVLVGKDQHRVAALLVSSTLHYLKTDLSKFAALNDLRLQIEGQLTELYDTLVDKLHLVLYSKPSVHKLGDLEAEEKEDQEHMTASTSKTTMQLMEILMKQNLFTPRIERYVKECVEVDLESNSVRFLRALVESLRTLGRLPTALEVLKLRLHRELSIVAKDVLLDAHKKQSMRASTSSKSHVSSSKKGNVIFTTMLEMLFDRFQDVMAKHVIILDCVRNKRDLVFADEYNDSVTSDANATKASNVYTDNDVWLAIQKEVQEVLSTYLAAPTMTMRGAGYSGKSRTIEFDWATLMTPRNLALEARDDYVPTHTLFTFSGSDFANTIDSKRETLEVGQVDRSHDMICEATPANLPLCFTPVVNFCRNMEARLMVTNDGSSPLQLYLQDYVTETYMDFLRSDIMGRLKMATDDPDAFSHNSTRLQKLHPSESDKLIKSAVVMERLLDELQELYKQLPSYMAMIEDVMVSVVHGYHTVCAETYHSIVMGDFENQQGAPITSKQQISKEINLLSRGVLRPNNIINYPGSYTALANMHFSLEWLASRPRHLKEVTIRGTAHVVQIPTEPARRKSGPSGSGTRLNPQVNISSLYVDLQHLADLCLLTLRMELRAQCYYYLITILQKSRYDLDEEALQPDPNVLRLNDILCAIDDSVSHCLPAAKVRFIFDLLDQLICKILTVYVSQIERINDKGIAKMTRNILGLRQNLTNITTLQSGEFEKATRFYELLQLPIE
eukprot:Ihof_evm1s490 gene=Ihof_evmTU1s490